MEDTVLDKEKRCCDTCSFYYSKLSEEIKVCNDYDGEYFLWEMLPTERCPDYEVKDSNNS